MTRSIASRGGALVSLTVSATAAALRRARAAIPLALLLVSAACPQLKDGDFETLQIGGGAGGGGSGATLAGSGGGAGASAAGSGGAPARAGTGGGAGVGGSAGAGGSTGVGGSAGVGGSGSGAPGADIGALAAALQHRYSFEGFGTSALDSVGTAHATLVDTGLTGSGSVLLAGTGQYIDFPNGLLSEGDNQTFEAWLVWNGGRSWQRIFDFGSSTADAGEGSPSDGATYLFLTPRSSTGTLAARFTLNGFDDEIRLNASGALPTGVLSHVAVVVDGTQQNLALYLEGLPIAATRLEGQLSAIEDVNCWMGLSQFAADPSLNASVTEFRIYHRALRPEEIWTSYLRGSDATF